MNNRVLKILFASIFVVLTAVHSQAQNAIVTTGGDAGSNGGSVSYTIGQMVIETATNGSFTLTEGVQQPFEIQTVGVDNYPNITLNAVVYPNPTADRLTLKINDVETFHETSLRATLYTTHGQPVQTINVTDESTAINMSNVAAGTYYLHVINNQTTLKTFKVVKTM